eukprot:2165072-Pyramimonas_sp.AAC.1
MSNRCLSPMEAECHAEGSSQRSYPPPCPDKRTREPPWPLSLPQNELPRSLRSSSRKSQSARRGESGLAVRQRVA